MRGDMTKEKIDSIESVIADLKAGRMVIVVDDADRENEGDLIMAGEFVTPQAINFMAKHGRGLICVPTVEKRLVELGIEPMVVHNRETYKTDFQVSVDAAHGISSGISAADRARTIRLMVDPKSRPVDLVQPGHIFPLRAKTGGVLQRAGHTEASVDLVGPRSVKTKFLSFRKQDGKVYRTNKLPDIPFAKCTCPEGCRCMIRAEV